MQHFRKQLPTSERPKGVHVQLVLQNTGRRLSVVGPYPPVISPLSFQSKRMMEMIQDGYGHGQPRAF